MLKPFAKAFEHHPPCEKAEILGKPLLPAKPAASGEAPVGETVLIAGKLKLNSNPFDASDGGGRLGRPLQKALGELIRHIGLETRIVVVPGHTGTGKTLLAKMAGRISTEMGLSVRRFDRGDAVAISGGQRPDVLLADEADTIPDSTLRLLLSEGDKRPATTTVLLCLPTSTRRFNAARDAVVVELARLSPSDTRQYLNERTVHAGFPNLFAPAAFHLLVDEAHGVPRTLWSIASLAYFYAASAGATQISRDHVARALASQIPHPEMPAVPVPSAPPVEPVNETPLNSPGAPRGKGAQGYSADIAAFKRHTIAEPPTHETEPQARPLSNTSSAVAPEELLKILAAASEHSATAAEELPIDAHKAESPKRAQTESIGLASANAGQESGSTRMPLVTVGSAPLGIAAPLADAERHSTRLLKVGSAVGGAAALAGTIALAIFVQSGRPAETALIAKGTRNIANTVPPPAANLPAVASAKALDAPQHATGEGDAPNNATSPSKPGRAPSSPPLSVQRTATLKAPQRPRRTSQAPVSASATSAERVRVLATAPPPVPALIATIPAPTTSVLLAPTERNAVTAAPVQVIAAADIGAPPSTAGADTAGAGTAVADRSVPYPHVFGLQLRGSPESRCLVVGRVPVSCGSRR